MQVFSEEGVVHSREGHFAWELNAAKSMCLWCGFMPIEGMRGYILIHGEGARCVQCHSPLPSVEPIDQ